MNKLIAFAERLARCPYCMGIEGCAPGCMFKREGIVINDELTRYNAMLEAREALKADKVTDPDYVIREDMTAQEMVEWLRNTVNPTYMQMVDERRLCADMIERLLKAVPELDEVATKENVQMVTFWLTNILRHLDNDKISTLIQQLNERLQRIHLPRRRNPTERIEDEA